MSKLSELLRERQATPANPANSANPPLQASEISSFSNISRGVGTSSQSLGATPARAPALIICAGCMHFRKRPGESPDGFCRRFDVETWGCVEFTCPGYELSDEATRAREARQARVAAELLANPAQRLAFDVVDPDFNAGGGDPISVILAVRTSTGVASGDVRIPRERFDAALFLRALDTSEKPS